MIYIVEIPHQMPAHCWAAANEEDAVSRIFNTFIRSGDTPETDAPFSEWMDYNGSDLHSQHVYLTAAEAVAGLDGISGHQSGKATEALRKALLDAGDLGEAQS